jgi:hypothetical protein
MSPRFPTSFAAVTIASLLLASGFGFVQAQEEIETEEVPRTSTDVALADTDSGLTKVTKGDGVLPNNHGQIWREYDISPYTDRVTTTARPEQAIVDWILRDTGTEVWFSDPVGLLSASREKLVVYNTPEMHELVRGVVDRFVSSKGASNAFRLQLVTVGSPNWRSKALPLMRAVTVQSPGVDAWLLSPENAAVLLNQLRKRTDFREHNSPTLAIHNGQSQSISRTRPRNYVRSVGIRATASPRYELQSGQIQEGFSLQISPLFSLDKRTVDAVIKCQIDQVEKFVPVGIDIPGVAAGRQSVQIQVPQLVSWRLHERFRWPSDQVLLVSCGVVATPTVDKPRSIGIPLLGGSNGRADAILFIQNLGKVSQPTGNVRTARGSGPNTRGRY